jgi:plasmid stabilization system protein ParE
MNRPSDKALALAEELVDYVHPGMPRAAATREVAEMIDAANEELLATIDRVLADTGQCGVSACSMSMSDLRKILRNYQPLPIHAGEEHEDLFGQKPPVQATLFAGGMP